MTDSSAPLWRLDLLGELRLTRLDRPDEAPITHFRSRKTAALLCFLALRRGAHRRDALGEMFWPETDSQSARNSLRVALSSLRALLEAPGLVPHELLIVAGECVALGRGVTSDVEAFGIDLRAARGATEGAARRAHLESALNWYRGPLHCGDDVADWPGGEADRLEDEFVRALGELLALVAPQNSRAALEIARSGLEKAPLREEIALEVLRLGLLSGEPQASRDFGRWQARVERRGLIIAPQSLARARAWQSAPNAADAAARAKTPGNTPRLVGLPRPWTPFFGRESELLDLGLTLRQARLLTLTGAPGIGKTRVGIELARRLAVAGASDFGLIIHLSLADLPVASLVPGALAAALGKGRVGGPAPTPLALLRAAQAPGGARTLLVLDGFEHLCDDGGPLVREWMQALPELSCLLLSQRALSFAGEVRRELGPLETGSSDSAIGDSAIGDGSIPAAVSLFCDRARAARPGWEMGEGNRAAVWRLCAALEGWPLALEIAAARLALFSPAQILAEIEADAAPGDSGSVLDWKNPDRAAPPRHATLRAAIAWSERQLPVAAARFWAQTAVFRGGFSLEAASQLCGYDAAPLVMALSQVSLLRLETRGESVRAVPLEPVRRYAWGLLSQSEREVWREKRAHLFARESGGSKSAGV